MTERITGDAVHMDGDNNRAVILIRGKDFYGKIDLVKGEEINCRYTPLKDQEDYISELENMELPYIMGGER